MFDADQISVSLDAAVLAHIAASPAVHQLIERRCIMVEAAAKRLCPVDTGRLRASISHVVTVEAGEVVGVVGSNVDYAPHQEYGTSTQPGTPFLRPALDVLL